MTTRERVLMLFAECNPVPGLAELDLSGSLPTADLSDLHSGTREMTELKSNESAPVLTPGWRSLILGVAAAAIVVAGAILLEVADDKPVVDRATSATSTTVMGSDVAADYVIDLNTGEMTPLPALVLSTLDPDQPFDPPAHGRYAVSSDGLLLAYVGNGSDGSPEVFVAGLDNNDVRQMTNHPTDVIAPAWSPDGAMIAYLGSEGLFVVDVATGEATQVQGVPAGAGGPQFTPDGTSLLYTFPSDRDHELFIVPIDGGNSTVLVGREQGMGAAAFGSLSPDGSLVTMLGHKINGPGAGLFLATTDGSEPRSMGLHSGNCRSYPAGAWSPDGSRIVCSGDTREILVVNVATGHAMPVAEGTGAIWVNDDVLLIID